MVYSSDVQCIAAVSSALYSVCALRIALLLSVVVRLEGLEAVFEVNSRYSDQELESDTEDSTVDCSTPACVPAADQENWD